MPAYLKTLDDFKKAIAEDSVVIIDFTASWCGPCRMIGPVFEKLAGQYGTIKCFKVDVDENSDAAGEAQIRAMPTFKVYKAGKQIDELMGASAEKLEAMFKKYA
ncbi:thioredoxin [Salpingoeca rosetta]|uniref:Thioredoxin n=1 Tax=Salpingoeca rosetta (strain ATCC 50818 / BSB-021) TaxID=946362 RepID=F2UQE1_SALR5|nr:thioredoxin [Salpingoeca rosetta]EGD79846.1 thioredoxin [Salpingoeca rosetta]|eukprot:XP_004988467.1 thioredoxin [Salpingoeca rosetta]